MTNWALRESATFDRPTIAAIQRAAETGIYDIRGWGAKRPLPHFDDLLFLGASMSRYPLEGYRERCGTDVVLGDRFAKHPLHLDIPVTIAGMSFGALSGPAKEALGRGASEVGTSTTTGDGGMTPEERGQSKYLVYQYLPSRYGMNPDDLRKADAIEVVLGQGAKPGGGGMLLGQKISERVAGMRTLPEYHLDSVRLAQVVGVHPVPRRKILVDKVLALPTLLGCHAAVTRGCRRAHLAGAAAQRLLGRPGQRTERHAGDRHRNIQVQWMLREPVAEHDIGATPLAITLERIARHRRTEEQQVVEMWQWPLGAPSANVVDAGLGGTLDGRDRRPVEGGGFAKFPVGHQ